MEKGIGEDLSYQEIVYGEVKMIRLIFKIFYCICVEEVRVVFMKFIRL